jgi:hypothetical protein
VFYLPEGVDCSSDSKLHGTVSLTRQEKNKRLYNFNIDCKFDDNQLIKGTYEIP